MTLHQWIQLIRENSPCHLYFDLEFNRNRNPQLELDLQKDQLLVDAFIAICIAYMREVLNVRCERDDVIDLDSTTVEKFSRHLIFRIPGQAWTSNAECGRFVRRLAVHLQSRQSEPLVAQFYVATEKPAKSLFVDMGVYTRNRNFRLMKSSKLGKGTSAIVQKPVFSAHSSKKKKKVVCLQPTTTTQSRFRSEKELFFVRNNSGCVTLRSPHIPRHH